MCFYAHVYMFRSLVCTVHALCMVTVQIACYNGDIEVGPDSRQVPHHLIGPINVTSAEIGGSALCPGVPLCPTVLYIMCSRASQGTGSYCHLQRLHTSLYYSHPLLVALKCLDAASVSLSLEVNVPRSVHAIQK